MKITIETDARDVELVTKLAQLDHEAARVARRERNDELMELASIAPNIISSFLSKIYARKTPEPEGGDA